MGRGGQRAFELFKLSWVLTLIAGFIFECPILLFYHLCYHRTFLYVIIWPILDHCLYCQDPVICKTRQLFNQNKNIYLFLLFIFKRRQHSSYHLQAIVLVHKDETLPPPTVLHTVLPRIIGPIRGGSSACVKGGERRRGSLIWWGKTQRVRLFSGCDRLLMIQNAQN